VILMWSIFWICLVWIILYGLNCWVLARVQLSTYLIYLNLFYVSWCHSESDKCIYSIYKRFCSVCQKKRNQFAVMIIIINCISSRFVRFHIFFYVAISWSPYNTYIFIGSLNQIVSFYGQESIWTLFSKARQDTYWVSRHVDFNIV